ncbi:MAG TPA: hypothetical protein VFB45_19365 [Pseudolabrys sp.]|nr:hypothetical protein [Pseudolabrys sp.]
MSMRKFGLAVVVAFAVAAPASAQLVNENLLVSMPDGYKVDYHVEKDDVIMTEMVPTAETVHDWTEMVTVQVFLGLNRTPPKEFMTGMADRWTKACPGALSHTIADTTENGYPTLVWIFTCPHNPETGKPEYTWFKAIAGKDSFYLVQKASKSEPTEEQITKWVGGYLKNVRVCDSRLRDRACPKVGK